MKRKTRTKALSWLLSLVMVLSLVPSLGLTAYADAAYSGGTGTEADPYLISTVDDWKALAAAVNGGEAYEGKYFKQTADLDMSKVSDIKPVGKMETPFAGNYDGNGFMISNATINGVTDVVYNGMVSLTVAGVFGSVAGGGSISNLVADNLTVNATDAATGFPFTYSGGLIAYAEGCTVANCSVSNSDITATGTQTTFAGGIVGFAAADGNNNITSAFSKCASEKNTVSAGVYAGGVVGAIQNNNNGTLSFTDCYSAKNTVNGEWISAFLGGSQRGNATLTNGFVYDCSAGSKGVFISETTTGKLNTVNCYYYDTHGLNSNAEDAISKTADEMKSLASALGDTFTDGELYPVFGHKHSFTYTRVDYKAPTPNEEGNEEYYIGSDGRFYEFDGENYFDIPEGSWIIPAISVTKVEAKAPTYTSEGNTEYYVGTDGKYYVKNGSSYTETTLEAVIIAKLVLVHSWDVAFNQSGENVDISISANNLPENAQIYVASYSKGILHDISFVTLTDNAASKQVSGDNIDTLSVFCWDENLSPLFVKEEYTLKKQSL